MAAMAGGYSDYTPLSPQEHNRPECLAVGIVTPATIQGAPFKQTVVRMPGPSWMQ